MARGYPRGVHGGVRLTFYGVRGSTPVDGPRYVRYGGNTSCAALEADGHPPLIFDMGTGLRAYGEDLLADGVSGGPTHPESVLAAMSAPRPAFSGSLLLSHLHWDHMQGLPFFSPLGDPESVLDVYGPRQDAGSLGEVFTGVMSRPYFPITPDQLGGAVGFHGVDSDAFGVNGAKVHTRWVRHTDPTLGFRVEVEGVSVAYLSDHASGCSDDPDDFIPDDVFELCDGVDLLIHDAQHTCAEFEAKRNWGHCTVDYAVHVAKESAAHTLALFHHCPSHSDDDIDRILLEAQDLSASVGGPSVLAAAEGVTVELCPPRAG